MIDINFIWEIGTIVFNVFAKIYNSLINGFILIRHDSEDADNLDFKYKTNNNFSAGHIYKSVVKGIKEFEENLPENSMSSNKFIIFGNELVAIDYVTYQNPEIFIFNGTTIEGEPVQIMQHISQLNILLMATRKTESQVTVRKIGFLGE